MESLGTLWTGVNPATLQSTSHQISKAWVRTQLHVELCVVDVFRIFGQTRSHSAWQASMVPSTGGKKAT
jgi:uncharacterized membrane protein